MSWRDSTDFRSCLLVSGLPVTPLNSGARAAGRRYEAGAIPHELARAKRTGGFVFVTNQGWMM